MNTSHTILLIVAALGFWVATKQPEVDARIKASPVAKSNTSDFQDDLVTSAIPAAKAFCAKPGNGWKTVAVRTGRGELVYHCDDYR